MYYVSTRDAGRRLTASQAIVEGLSRDGGLYLPEEIPQLTMDEIKALAALSYPERAAKIMKRYLDEFTEEELLGFAKSAYGPAKFDTPAAAPVVKLTENTYIQELWHGPTSAFKDMALQCLPHFFSASAEKLREEGTLDHEFMILVATSGDTGKAALEGFHDVPGTRIIVFYPHGGVSTVQQAQMATQEGSNVCVCAVRGNFDDAQTGVKNIFAACQDKDLHGVRLSSANSINIGRLAPQVMYYFRAYADLVKAGRIRVGDTVHYVVPTGNFGDILAGYFAKLMGLPVGKLVCASNANDVLTEFLSTGVYDKRRPFHKTTSPSMDILVSSNLERMLYLLSDGDDAYVAGLMRQLRDEGRYQVTDKMLARLHEIFSCACCDDAQAAEVMGRVWREHGYVCDPHTAVAWHAADAFMEQADGAPVVVLSTASPYKFPAAVLSALGEEPGDDEFAMMDKLSALTGTPIPKNLATLREKQVRHKDVIDKDAMLDYVLGKIQSK